MSDVVARIRQIVRIRRIVKKISTPPGDVAAYREHYRLIVEALELVDPDAEPALWGWLQVNAAELVAIDVSVEEAPAAFALAIEHFEHALTFYTSDAAPVQCARVHEGLAMVYQVPVHADPAHAAEQQVRHLECALGLLEGRDPAWFASVASSLAEVLLSNAPAERDRLRALTVSMAGLAALPPEDDRHQRSALETCAARAFALSPHPDDNERAIGHYEAALDGAPQEKLPALHYTLGAVYHDRRIGDMAENIERAVEYQRSALSALSPDGRSAVWIGARLTLGTALAKRTVGSSRDNVEEALAAFDDVETATRDVADDRLLAFLHEARGEAYLARVAGDHAANTELAIEMLGRALNLYTALDDVHGATLAHGDLGLAYLQRTHGDHADNLETAIAHMMRAELGLDREATPFKWAQLQNNLAAAFRIRVRGDRAENVERAIEQLEASLEVYTRDATPAEWALAYANLATTRWARIVGSRAGNIETAISDSAKALSVFDDLRYPARRAEAESTRALLQLDRILGERAENVEQALGGFRRAMELYKHLGDQWKAATAQVNLALAYQARVRDDRGENLERAIELFQSAAAVITREQDPVEWAKLQHNLSHAYLERAHGNRADNVEDSISCSQAALEVRRLEALPEAWADSQDSLGAAYTERLLGDAADNSVQAVAAYRQALRVYTHETHPRQWARINSNMALALLAHSHSGKGESVEEAISRTQEALEVATRTELPDEWARNHNVLGGAFLNRITGDEKANLSAAAHHLELALEVRTREASPLYWADIQINLASVKVQQGGTHNGLRALEHIRLAGQVNTREADAQRWARGEFIAGRAYTLLWETRRLEEDASAAAAHYASAIEAQPRATFPGSRLAITVAHGDLYFSRGAWAEAHQAYDDALATARVLSEAAYTEVGRNDIRETIARAHSNAALSLLQLGNPAAALACLEQGKTRALAEALALRDADLGSLPEPRAAVIRHARQELRAFEAEMRTERNTPGRRSDAELGALLSSTRVMLRTTLEDIRKDWPDFMPTGLDVPGLLRAIPVGCVLVVFLVTSRGGAAFVLPAGAHTVDDRHIVRLPRADQAWLLGLLFGNPSDPGWLIAYARARTTADAAQRWTETIESVTADLWNVLIEPVLKRIHELGAERDAQLVLCPQGALGLFPLHAAWRDEGGRRVALLDDHAVSYTPSGYALAASRRRSGQAERQGRRLLSVVDPTSNLDYAVWEGKSVARHFDDAVILVGEQATQQAVIEAASDRTFLHFACHGHYNWTDITSSALDLAGGNLLTVADLLSDRVNLSMSRLVTLSACETGMIDIRRSADEYVGMPAGFLQAGAPSVLSTLWAVNDLSAALIVERFHERHLRDGIPAAQALRHAQLEVRDLTYDELLSRLTASREGQQGERGTDAVLVPPTLSDTPFVQPYHWAAFILTGT